MNLNKTTRILLMSIRNQLTSIRFFDRIVLNCMHVHRKVLLKVITAAWHNIFCFDCYFGFWGGILLFVGVKFDYKMGNLIWIHLCLPFSFPDYLKERCLFKTLPLLTLEVKTAPWSLLA